MSGDRRLNGRGLDALRGHADLSLPTFAGPRYYPSTSKRISTTQAEPVRVQPPDGLDLNEVKKVDLVVAIDDSGSVYAPWGDPHGVRRAAGISVARLLARSKGARVGVVHWGTNAPEQLAVPLTDARQRKAIEAAFAIPPTLGGNNFPAALARSREVLQASDPSRTQIVYVITDGIEVVGSAAVDEVKLLSPGSVHVLLVDHSRGCTPELEAGWAALPLGSFTRLEVFDTKAMANQIAEIVARATAVTTP